MTYVMGVLIFLKICFGMCILNLHIFNSDFVSKDERAYYEAICGRKDPDHGANALNFLSGVLFRYYNKKVIILLDEYDTPLIEAFSEGCWNEMFKYIKFLFSNSFKNNE